MSTQSPRPQNDPVLIAFQKLKKTPEYKNAVNWVLRANNECQADGELWFAFLAGYDTAAFSLFRWKDVADGLPEATGLFVVSIKGRGLMITGFAVDSDSDKWRWEDKYDSYIPYPIPECEMTNKQCKEKQTFAQSTEKWGFVQRNTHTD